MQGQLFYSSNLWVVLMSISITLMGMALIGFRLGRRASLRGADQSQLSAVQGSVLGLLALMLGFTFGASSVRYDARRDLMIAEANAIGTTFLRAQTLPEPYKHELSVMLSRYIDLRLRAISIIGEDGNLRKVQEETLRVQQAMWRRTAAVVRQEPNDITGLFEESLNQSIDFFASRVAMFQMRVPGVILWVLAIIAMVALGMVGYGFGMAGQRGWLIMALLSVIVALVIAMIVDLDRPEAGPTRASQQTMIDVRESIADYLGKVRR